MCCCVKFTLLRHTEGDNEGRQNENSKVSRDASEDISNRYFLFTVLYLYYSLLLKRGGSKNEFLYISRRIYP